MKWSEAWRYISTDKRTYQKAPWDQQPPQGARRKEQMSFSFPDSSASERRLMKGFGLACPSAASKPPWGSVSLFL